MLKETFTYQISVLGFKKEFEVSRKVSDEGIFFYLDFESEFSGKLQKLLKLPKSVSLKLESFFSQKLIKVFESKSDFKASIYEGYYFKEVVNGKEKRISLDELVMKPQSYFFDPLGLFFLLSVIKEKNDVLLLSNRKFKQVSIDISDENGTLVIAGKKVSVILRDEIPSQLSITILPFVSLSIDKV